MTEPEQQRSGPEAPSAAADPTLKVARPPVPGRAVRAQIVAGDLATPPVRPDEPTGTLDAGKGESARRTLEFGRPDPLRVTVAPRPKVRRRHRTWPWIAAVVVALVILGAVLLLLHWQGATVDGDVDPIGAGYAVAGGGVGPFAGD